MQVRFWGARGSIAVSGAGFESFGGRTACVEVQHEGEVLLLDGGTGLQALGASLRGAPLRAAMLFSHVHWDHIQGIPFFAPLFHPGSHLQLACAARPSGTLRDALAEQMRPPRFPVGLDTFGARLDFVDLDERLSWSWGPFTITGCDLHHPDGVVAWRVAAGGRAVVYATDVEHGEALDERLVRFAEGADLLVHDAQYTAAEYRGEGGPCRRGWGHATVEDATAVARQAGVGRLALFHHDPTRVDAAVTALEQAARQRFPATFAARDDLALAV
jgi:phosphoribosyl 1,2-cyclic phosphodiesterase